MTDLDRLASARLWAAYNYPYLASALFAIRFVPAENKSGVAADEHFRMYVDPQQTADWTSQLLGVEMVHQVSHLLRSHASRAREIGLVRDDMLHWVDAVDAEINDDLIDTHVAPADSALPADLGLAPALFAEEYFINGERRFGKQRDCGSAAHGDPRQWEEPPARDDVEGVRTHEADLIRRRVASEVLDHERRHGTSPGGLLRWADSLLNPRVDWRKELGATLRRGVAEISGAVDYSYRRPSRRAWCSPDVILPSLRRRLPHVAVVCDTSASMSKSLLAEALTEIDGLLTANGVRLDAVKVFTCDVEAGPAQLVRSASQVRLVGGGGTDLTVGIDAAVQSKPRPDLVVVITDGCTPWPASAPRAVRTLGVLLGENPPPHPGWVEGVTIDDVPSLAAKLKAS